MTLLDVLLAIILSLGVVLAGNTLINGQFEAVRQMERLVTYSTDFPAVRSIITRSAEQSARTVLYDTATNARAGGDTGRAATGAAVRMFYTTGPFVPSGQSSWGASLEFRNTGNAATTGLYYVNLNASGVLQNEWLVALGTGSFSIVEGVLIATFTARDSGGSRTSDTGSSVTDTIACAIN